MQHHNTTSLYSKRLTFPIIAPVNKITELVPLVDENGNPLKVIADVDYVEIRKECEEGSSDETDDTDEERNKALSDCKNCYMWIYASVYGTDRPIMLFDYQPSRGGYNCCNYFFRYPDGLIRYGRVNKKRLREDLGGLLLRFSESIL